MSQRKSTQEMCYLGRRSLGRAPLDSHCFLGVALELSLIGQPKPVNRPYKGSGQIESAFAFLLLCSDRIASAFRALVRRPEVHDLENEQKI